MDRATTTDPGRTPPGSRPDPPSRAPGVVALLTLATVAAALAGPWDPPMNDRRAAPNEVLPTEAVPTLPPLFDDSWLELFDTASARPRDLTWLGLILLAVLAFWIGYLVLWWLRRHPLRPLPGPPDDGGILPGQAVTDQTEAPSLPVLREGISTAGDELLAGRSPVDAVIAAWVALESAAARSGVVRDPASTPTEFTVAVLDSTPADPSATRSLLTLYLRARFGGEYMSERDVAVATAALRALAAGLGTDVDDDGDDDPDGGP